MLSSDVVQARSFGAYLVDFQWSEVFPGADRFGPKEGDPPAVAAYKGDKLLGYAFVTADAVSSIGYSGKAIRVVAGIDLQGNIVGVKLIEHHEPILLVGIPEEKLLNFVERHHGLNVQETLAKGSGSSYDAISGATVTAIVVRESILRGGMKILRTRNLAGLSVSQTTAEKIELAPPPFTPRTWDDLLGDGSIRRLLLTNRDVNAAFARQKVERADFDPAPDPDSVFIDLYATLITPESIGRNLLGEAEYGNLIHWLAPNQQAILLMANGQYSFRGSGFVRGAIFDRFQLQQGDASIIFRDKHYRRLGTLAPADAPDFAEVALLKIPEETVFDPAKPWRIDLLVFRATGAIEKKFTVFQLHHALPEIFLKRTTVPVSGTHASTPGATSTTGVAFPEETFSSEPAIWKKIWRDRTGSIAILCAAMGILTWIFFFQEWIVQRPRLFSRLKYGFLFFSLFWIGYYTQAQLSVVNVLTFVNAMFTGFRWDYFLLEPLIFILWVGVAVSLLFWGRGAFCGWLCPFGAMQELINKGARLLNVRQISIKFRWHERLWTIKYMILLTLFGVSLHAMAMAEHYAEIEPFKTTILLKFQREWEYVFYAVGLLAINAVIYRFFCRYLCPLGAALAIPCRLRMFEWLKRRHQCGSECQLCAQECHIQAIHPEGHINPNECFYCMDCQVIYSDKTRCPPLIQREGKRLRRQELKSNLARKNPTDNQKNSADNQSVS
ncbi:MAG: regulatory protein NosR [Magnetococcales bacterium]|nr:regulatory protein NosR [Magnetococcales bacterium]